MSWNDEGAGDWSGGAAGHRHRGAAERRAGHAAFGSTWFALTRAEVDLTDGRGAARRSAGLEARHYSQLRRLQPRRSGRGRSQAGARRERLRAARPGRGRRGDRRHVRPLQHRLRVRREGARSRTRRPIPRVRRASTAPRSCSASGSPRRRRGTTCCASRACSAAPTSAAASTRSSRPSSKGEDTRVFVDRVVTPSYVEDVVTATLAPDRRGRPVRPLSLRELRRDHLVRAGARRSRGCWTGRRRWCR